MRLRTKGWRMKGCRVCVHVCAAAPVSTQWSILFREPVWMPDICDFASWPFSRHAYRWEETCRFDECANASACMASALYRYFAFVGWNFARHTGTLAECALVAWALPSRLYTPAQLSWKRMGEKLGLSGDPTLLINTVHWQGAPVRSKIKCIWRGETPSERKGWTKRNSPNSSFFI